MLQCESWVLMVASRDPSSGVLRTPCECRDEDQDRLFPESKVQSVIPYAESGKDPIGYDTVWRWSLEYTNAYAPASRQSEAFDDAFDDAVAASSTLDHFFGLQIPSFIVLYPILDQEVSAPHDGNGPPRRRSTTMVPNHGGTTT
jgi:hypothetical protein